MLKLERIDENYHRFMFNETGKGAFVGLKFVVNSKHMWNGRIGIDMTFIFKSEAEREKIIRGVIEMLRECCINDPTFGEIVVDDVAVHINHRQETILMNSKLFGFISREITAWVARVTVFGDAA